MASLQDEFKRFFEGFPDKFTNTVDDGGHDLRRKYEFPGRRVRLYAAIIDLSVPLMCVPLLMVGPLFGLLTGMTLSVLYSSYTISTFGGTFGQQFFRLVVLDDEEGNYLELPHAFKRSALAVASFLMVGHGFWSIFFVPDRDDSDEDCFHDRATGTVVMVRPLPKGKGSCSDDDETIPFDYPAVFDEGGWEKGGAALLGIALFALAGWIVFTAFSDSYAADDDDEIVYQRPQPASRKANRRRSTQSKAITANVDSESSGRSRPSKRKSGRASRKNQYAGGFGIKPGVGKDTSSEEARRQWAHERKIWGPPAPPAANDPVFRKWGWIPVRDKWFDRAFVLLKNRQYRRAYIVYLKKVSPLTNHHACRVTIDIARVYYRYGKESYTRRLLRRVIISEKCGRRLRNLSKVLWEKHFHFNYIYIKG